MPPCMPRYAVIAVHAMQAMPFGAYADDQSYPSVAMKKSANKMQECGASGCACTMCLTQHQMIVSSCKMYNRMAGH